MNSISEQEFIALSKKGNLVPVYKEIVADMDTPVSAYYKVGTKAKYSFLLESVEGEEKIARFSFLARNPELLLESKGNSARIVEFTKKGKPAVKQFSVKETPLEFIRQIFKKYRFVEVPHLPRFCGGMVGFGTVPHDKSHPLFLVPSLHTSTTNRPRPFGNLHISW